MQFRFWYPKDIIGYLVCWWTSSQIAHVSIIIGDKEWEALPCKTVWGRQPRPFKGIAIDVELTQEQEKEVLRYLESCKGQTYDYRGIWGFIFPFIHQNELQKFCSELVYRAGIRIDIFPIEAYPYRLSPFSIYLLLLGRKQGLQSIPKSV